MNPVPPKIVSGSVATETMASGNVRFAALVVAVVAAGIAATVFFFNPRTHGFYPVCQFHRLTGLNCPGCGMTRSLYALLHGDFSAALRDNALFLGGLALLAGRAGWWGVENFLGRKHGQFFPARWLWPLLAVALGFTVLRNLPAFAFLSP
jgi:hypothetical protein